MLARLVFWPKVTVMLLPAGSKAADVILGASQNVYVMVALSVASVLEATEKSTIAEPDVYVHTSHVYEGGVIWRRVIEEFVLTTVAAAAVRDPNLTVIESAALPDTRKLVIRAMNGSPPFEGDMHNPVSQRRVMASSMKEKMN
jgi:hypothetical protein